MKAFERPGGQAALLVADEVARDLKNSGAKGPELLGAISELAAGAARGAADAGAGIGAVAEGFMIGAMCGAQETPEKTLDVIGHAAGAFIRHAYQAGFSAASAARGLIEGAGSWADKCALDERSAAGAAAQAASDAAAALISPDSRR